MHDLMRGPDVTRRPLRRSFTTVAGLAAAALAATAAAPPVGAAPGDREITVAKAPSAQSQNNKVKAAKTADKLGRHDRDLLEKAVDTKASRVVVMISTEKGQTADAVKAIKASGGVVATVNDRVGYISASVPTGKVDAVAKNAAIVAVDLNERIALPQPEADKASGVKAVRPARALAPPTTTRSCRRATSGRSPSRRRTRPWTAAARRSVSSTPVSTSTTPRCRRPRPASARSSTGSPARTRSSRATAPGARCSRPSPVRSSPSPRHLDGARGHLQVPAVAETISAAAEAKGDFNRDGDTTDRWGILYDEATNDIWVDANQDRTFSDREKMRPYKEKFDIGHFGVDNPATAIAESMPFVVEFREDVDMTPAGLLGQKADFVNIGVVESAHGTHVAGITAATRSSVARWTARRPAPRSSRAAPAPGVAAAPRSR